MFGFNQAKRPPCGSNIYIATGDSITTGVHSGNVGYVELAALGNQTVRVNTSISGSGMEQAATTTIDGLVAQRCSSAIVVASELYGYNDYSVGDTTGSFLSELATWADARRLAGVKVIICTLLPSPDPAEPGYNAWRNTVNAALATYAPGGGGTQHCDALADFAADAIMGPDNSPNTNPSYWFDVVHPNLLGQQRLTPIMQAALLSLLPF